MKKFSKLLAVVLAIAVIICPMISSVAYAESENGFALSCTSKNDVVFTIDVPAGMLLYKATLDFGANDAFKASYAQDGYTDGFKVVDYTLADATAEKDEYNAPMITAKVDGTTVSFILQASDAANVQEYAQVKVGMRVADGATVSLVNFVGMTNRNDNNLPFDGINTSTGVVDTDSAAYKAAGSIKAEDSTPVAEFDFGTATYDLDKNELSVPYGAPNAALLGEFSAASTAGNRTVDLVCDVDGKEFVFSNLKIGGNGGTLKVSGFALPHMNVTVKVFVRLAATGIAKDYNAYTVVIKDMITDSKWIALNTAYAAGNEDITVTNATIDTGLYEFTTVKYSTQASKLSVSYNALCQDLLDVFAAAKTAGNRKVQLICDIEGKEFVFDAPAKAGAGTLEVSGFSLSHFTKDVKIFVRITADSFSTYESNKVTVNIDSALQAATGDYAEAYQAFVAAPQ